MTKSKLEYNKKYSIYHPRSPTSTSSKIINELILKQLLPKYEFIFSQADPLPAFGLKLLSSITERNSAFVAVLKKENLIHTLLDYYSSNR